MTSNRLFVSTTGALALLFGVHGSALAQPTFPVDHYMCYMAVPTTPASNAIIAIKDQFDQYFSTQQRRKRVSQARMVCNPVTKQHNGVVTEPMYPEVHLVCFNVIPKQPLPLPAYTYENQFGPNSPTALVQRESMMCVPSFKRPADPAGG